MCRETIYDIFIDAFTAYRVRPIVLGHLNGNESKTDAGIWRPLPRATQSHFFLTTRRRPRHLGTVRVSSVTVFFFIQCH